MRTPSKRSSPSSPHHHHHRRHPIFVLLLLLLVMALSPSSPFLLLARAARLFHGRGIGSPLFTSRGPTTALAFAAGGPYCAAPCAAFRHYRLTPRCEAPRSPVPIPHDRLEFSYSRSSGPGGQNVNKLNTRVELRFEVAGAEWIPEAMRQRFQVQQRHRINKAGEFVVASQEHRTQLKNREDCLSKLEEALAQAAVVPKTRNMRTGLTEWEKENRLREKKRRAETKSARRQKHNYDD